MSAVPVRIVVALVAYAVSLAAAGWIGWEWRDRSADLATQTAATAAESARADAATDARVQDHANAQAAAVAEQARAEQQADSDTQFRIIEREVVRYVQANPDPAGCDLDGDGLRAWRAANAGQFPAEPADRAGPSSASSR